MLTYTDVNSPLRAIWQTNLMINFHFAYTILLVHFKETEACGMKVAQLKDNVDHVLLQISKLMMKHNVILALVL